MNTIPVSQVGKMIPSPLVIETPKSLPVPPLNPMSFMDIIKQSGDYYEKFNARTNSSSVNWSMLLDVKM